MKINGDAQGRVQRAEGESHRWYGRERCCTAIVGFIFSSFCIPRRMGKNTALAHHTSTYFSYASSVDLTQLLGILRWWKRKQSGQLDRRVDL